MNHNQFLRAFYPRADKVVVPSGKGATPAWTEEMCKILKEIGEEAGFHVCCKGLGGHEFKRMDFTYFPRAQVIISGDDTKIQGFPVCVIEHENNSKLNKLVEDFHKLCGWPVPLRIMIGLGKTKDMAEERVTELRRYYDENLSPTQVLGAETVLLIGWRGRSMAKRKPPAWRHWLCWLRQGESPWVQVDRRE